MNKILTKKTKSLTLFTVCLAVILIFEHFMLKHWGYPVPTLPVGFQVNAPIAVPLALLCIFTFWLFIRRGLNK